MSYTLRRESHLGRFRNAVEPFLRQQESANNLILGLLGRSHADDPPEVMALVEDSQGPILVALKTDPAHALILSFGADSEASITLAKALHQSGLWLPGVLGPRPTAVLFSETWARQTGTSPSLLMRERIYQATQVVPPVPAILGHPRWATLHDVETIIPWFEAFAQEAMPEESPNQAKDLVKRRLEDGFPVGGFLLWEVENQIVSLAGYGSPTGNGVRVGPVYTPPYLRGHGYASHLVASLTETLLTSGYRQVFLFTDVANPTPNAIYQKIGYRPVTDVDHYQFKDSGS